MADCEKKAVARGWCPMHWSRWRVHGDVLYDPWDERRRIMAKVSQGSEDECWEWQGPRLPAGYGRVRFSGKDTTAHRAVYELLVGPIPDGLVIDHLCRNPPCVNPAHLDPVPQRLNVLRGESLASQQARRTHCPRGHPYSSENTYTSTGHRVCRTCAIARSQRDRDRRKVG